MSTSKLASITDGVRIYTLVKIKGETRLAVRTGDRWEIDSVCRSINEMLELDLISEDIVLGWIHKEGALLAP